MAGALSKSGMISKRSDFAYFLSAPGARAAGMKKRRNDTTQDISQNTKDTRKRKQAADIGGLDDGDVEQPPVKRQRGRAQALDVVPMSASPGGKSDIIRTKNRRSTNRYGKKGRTSSPAPSALLAIDYDELPDQTIPSKSEAPPPIQKRRLAKEPVKKATTALTSTSKTRASAMRRKDEKLTVPAVKADKKEPKARPKPALKADKAKVTPIIIVDQREEQWITKPKPEISEPNNVRLLYVCTIC